MSATATALPTPFDGAAAPAADTIDATYRKLTWRLVPFLFLCYVVAFLDRINIGYAQLQMKQTLPFSDAVYGLGAGIFFLGYFLFEVPSNLMLAKVGARRTLLRIMFCWGVAASAMMFVSTPTMFYVLRFLLGVFEAGFFPGVLLYLTYWYPNARRGRIIALFMTATTIAGVVAGPLSGGIMKYMDGINGWAGWQWLFLVQGLPASVLGVAAYFFLQDKPEDARWLTAEEKAIVRGQLAQDQQATASHGSFWQLLRDPKVYVLSLIYFLLLGAAYAIIFWVPTVIRSWGVTDMLQIGLYAAIPNLIGAVAMVFVGRHSDAKMERRWHLIACVLLASVGMLLTVMAKGDLVLSLAFLSLAVVGVASATPIFFTIPTAYLSPASAAAGLAVISSLGNLGAAVSPSLTGLISARTGNPLDSMFLVIALYAAVAAIVWLAVPAKMLRKAD
ncbi:MFS transporter [Ramlibacter albus]|uniref:MFS transporter n=1 Tax=Ramlibacter albus TaxID=2079448 RepID=A0A923M9G7_9BURK|nr:MFS transporter [Ramlibacter albus]MBC5764957.1 MFS transporter [Ramlibacter albus]